MKRNKKMMHDREIFKLPGLVMIVFCVGLLGLGMAGFVILANESILAAFLCLGVSGLGFISLKGLTMVDPNEARVFQLFGSYAGTIKEAGFWWVNPFAGSRRISMRVRSTDSAKLKVNDHAGNPIEIAAVIVWRVVDCARACLSIDDYMGYMNTQAETAVRDLASRYSYDDHHDGSPSLRGNSDLVAQELLRAIQNKLGVAGVEIVDARVSHLAYAPEIAHAMLQKQQASAIVAARQLIVEGAVGMVEAALMKLSEKRIVELDEERKAQMVANLLVVLCGDRAAQPIVNTGSIYQ
jgi:hypothetical protein